MTSGDGDPKAGVFQSLTPKNQERLARILSEYLPELITADQVIVQKTGYSSEISKNNQVDVLAHLAYLAEKQDELDEDQQASQLAKIEEHLRRAIVEHPEEVLRDRIGDVEELWAEYQREAFELRENNELHGAPRHKDLENLRHRMNALMEAARKTKPKETTWDETLTAAARMTEAADLAGELADKLHECIGRARQIRDEKRHRQADEARRDREEDGIKKRWAIGIAVTIALAVFGGGGYLVGQGADDGTSKQAETCSAGKSATTASNSDRPKSDKKPSNC
jgi:hypothetical protein